SLISSLTLGRLGRRIPANLGTRLGTGLLSGAMSAAAGAGGPAVSAYAVLTNWQQRSFAATLQPFLVAGTASAVVMKVIVNGWARGSVWRSFPRRVSSAGTGCRGASTSGSLGAECSSSRSAGESRRRPRGPWHWAEEG